MTVPGITDWDDAYANIVHIPGGAEFPDRGLRDAAAARTVRPSPVQLVTPAVIATVDYAHRTGEALAARGLE